MRGRTFKVGRALVCVNHHSSFPDWQRKQKWADGMLYGFRRLFVIVSPRRNV